MALNPKCNCDFEAAHGQSDTWTCPTHGWMDERRHSETAPATITVVERPHGQYPYAVCSCCSPGITFGPNILSTVVYTAAEHLRRKHSDSDGARALIAEWLGR